MNAIENNEYTRVWETLGEKIPKPKAILSVSAHWFKDGTRVSDAENPETIYDMYGFPQELYDIVYGAKGSPAFAQETKRLIGGVSIDNSWGLDHGTWSVLHRVYPAADIPVFQLSVDKNAWPQEHYEIGRKIKSLRELGVLVFGSGNIVHNLSRLDWQPESCYDWAREFDGYIKSSIMDRNFENVIRFENAGKSAGMAFNTLDHYAPLLYVLGASDEKDKITVFNDSCTMGSISMTSYLFE
jgi:4,5-DOPA dioxygenase extradiol